MAVAAYNATVTVGSSTIVHDIQGFDLPFKMDNQEVTVLSSSAPGTKAFIPTLLNMQVKLNGFWNKTDAGQLSLETAFFARTKLNFIFSPDGVKTYSLSSWLVDYDIKTDPKSAVNADFTLQMDGGVTIV